MLALESLELAERAHIVTVKTPLAGAQPPEDSSAGLVAIAAAPIFDDDGEIRAVLCGGQLLNQRASIVDRIRSSLYRAEKYNNHDVGVVSIFLGDKRIATTLTSPDGARRVGTLISAATHDRVFSGKESIEPSYIVDDWYLGAYTPIRDPDGHVIGALGLGLLQSKFKEAEQRAWWTFRWVIASAGLLAIAISYGLSKSIMRPLRALIAAKEKMIAGASLDLVELHGAPPEIEVLGNTFNTLVSKLREREEEMRATARRAAHALGPPGNGRPARCRRGARDQQSLGKHSSLQPPGDAAGSSGRQGPGEPGADRKRDETMHHDCEKFAGFFPPARTGCRIDKHQRGDGCHAGVVPEPIPIPGHQGSTAVQPGAAAHPCRSVSVAAGIHEPDSQCN